MKQIWKRLIPSKDYAVDEERAREEKRNLIENLTIYITSDGNSARDRVTICAISPLPPILVDEAVIDFWQTIIGYAPNAYGKGSHCRISRVNNLGLYSYVWETWASTGD